MGWMVKVTPWPLYPRERPGTTLYRRLGGLQDWSGRLWKISPPPGFDPRTVQPVASRYTDSIRLTSDEYDKFKSRCDFYRMLLLMLKGEYVDYDEVVVRFGSVRFGSVRFGSQVLQDMEENSVFQLVLIIPTSYVIHYPHMSQEKLWDD